MTARRYVAALTNGQLDAALHAVDAAQAGGSGGDFTDQDLRLMAKVEEELRASVVAGPAEVIVALTRAQADVLVEAWALLDAELDQHDATPEQNAKRRLLNRAGDRLNDAMRRAR